MFNVSAAFCFRMMESEGILRITMATESAAYHGGLNDACVPTLMGFKAVRFHVEEFTHHSCNKGLSLGGFYGNTDCLL